MSLNSSFNLHVTTLLEMWVVPLNPNQVLNNRLERSDWWWQTNSADGLFFHHSWRSTHTRKWSCLWTIPVNAIFNVCLWIFFTKKTASSSRVALFDLVEIIYRSSFLSSGWWFNVKRMYLKCSETLKCPRIKYRLYKKMDIAKNKANMYYIVSG